MNLKYKATLLFCSLLISFVGAMPANAIICVSDSGSIKLEVAYNGSCDCEEESAEHSEHPACEDTACNFVELQSSACSDIEIESFESDQRSHSVDFYSYRILSLFDFSFYLGTKSSQRSPSFWPLCKPSIPPPHLEVLASTQILI